jgi:homoaconitate hydratase
MAQNLIEKIVQAYCAETDTVQPVKSGDYITIRPAYVMTHDNTGAVIPKFNKMGTPKVAFPRQIVFALDHNIQDTTAQNLNKYQQIEAFAKQMHIDFYPAGRGIGHQIMCEEGYVWPGTLVVASDSHATMYGGLGCLGTPIVRTDAAAIWASGKTWWYIPPVIKINLKNQLPRGVTGKDLIITLCGYFNHDEVLNHALEFGGEGVSALSIDQRLTIANMSTEWGALAAVFPTDETTLHWLKERIGYVKRRGLAGVPSDSDGQHGDHPRLNSVYLSNLEQNIRYSDPQASYAAEITIDLATISPHVAGPDTVKRMTPISAVEKLKIKIDKAYLLSCVNSRLEDLADAAAVVKNKKIHPRVQFYTAAASSEIQSESEKRGDWQTLMQAGARPLPPGCGPCIGLGSGLLEKGEIGISATNRNFKGRMGSKDAHVYLASPAIVAASALTGHICGLDVKPATTVQALYHVNETTRPVNKQSLLSCFPAQLQGELVFCPVDNLNTDGIYPGKYTYRDDFTPQQQAEVVMENYDPAFKQLIRAGDILIAGYNFGTGSSREQAATALKFKGILLILAGSFNETYKRNALNNGFLPIEVPDLVTNLKTQFKTDKATIRTGLTAHIDFVNAKIDVETNEYKIDPIGKVAQELFIAGGIENVIKQGRFS